MPDRVPLVQPASIRHSGNPAMGGILGSEKRQLRVGRVCTTLNAMTNFTQPSGTLPDSMQKEADVVPM